MSKLLDKNFNLDYFIDKLPGCCGIWEMRELYWDYVDFAYNEYPSLRRMKQEAKRVKKEALRTGKCVICTITDDIKPNRMLLEAFKHVGWKEHRKVKSNHGKYYIHLLSIQRRKK